MQNKGFKIRIKFTRYFICAAGLFICLCSGAFVSKTFFDNGQIQAEEGCGGGCGENGCCPDGAGGYSCVSCHLCVDGGYAHCENDGSAGCSGCMPQCNDGATEGVGNTSKCGCCCNCSNTIRCGMVCTDTCPAPGDTCEPDCDQFDTPDHDWYEGSGGTGNCRQTASCSGTKSDCTTCQANATCSTDETNSTLRPCTFLDSNSLYLCVGDLFNCTALSKVADSPTEIAPIAPGVPVYLLMGAVTPPDGARGIRYFFRLDNTGDGSWDCANPGDFCQDLAVVPNTTDISSKIVQDVKFAGWAHVATRDYCDEDLRFADDGVGNWCLLPGYFIIRTPHVGNPPNIDAVNASGNLYVGTSTDADNGPTCTDNNPYTYTTTVSDADGSADIDFIEFNMSTSEYTTPTGYPHWQLRAFFMRSWGGTLASPTFMFRDARVSADPVTQCFKGDHTLVSDPTGGCFYNLPDGHTQATATHTTTTLPGGHVADVYYLNSDILVYADGYSAILKAAVGGDWDTGTYVVSDQSGNNVWAYFKIEFLNDGHKTWENTYNNIWTVSDMEGSSDTSLIPGLGGQLIDTGYGVFHAYGTTKIDFTAPTPVTVNAQHVDGDPDNTLRFYQEAHDNRGKDSGLNNIYDRWYTIAREGIRKNIGSKVVFGSPTTDWALTPPADYISGFLPDDTYTYGISAVDYACNATATTGSGGGSSGHPWLQTLNNDTFAALGFNDPIPDLNPVVAMGSHWVGGGNSLWSYGFGISSGKAWNSTPYDDANRSKDWYSELLRLAGKSSYPMTYISNENLGSPEDIVAAGADGIYSFSYSVAATPTLTSVCHGKKVIFLPSNATLHVVPNNDPIADDAACLIVSAGSIQIDAGASQGGGEELVNYAFITNGEFMTNTDNDRLRLNGFVFSSFTGGSTRFRRDLDDDTTNPAELLNYDPRYLNLLRDLIGEKPISQIECGIVKDSPACEGW